MRINKGGIASKAVAIAMLSFVTISLAEAPSSDPVTTAPPEMASGQQMLKLQVRVVDADGKPVAKAKITPWALRASRGHSGWVKDDKRAGVGPKDVFTDEDGTAAILYPRYRDVQEQIRTTAVSLFVDHPDFAYIDSLHIDVPLESKGSYEIRLTAGVPLEIRTLIDDKPADLNDLFVLWSDGRSWNSGAHLEKSADGNLRIPAMPPGKNSVLLVKLDGDRATHFSKITDIELKPGETKRIDVSLHPSLRIRGSLSDDVPRPIHQGRLQTSTLPPADADSHRVRWFSWAAIHPDGTFVIDGWPADERLQLIALCEGYIATSGNAPDVVEHPRDPKDDPFGRPQVFDPGRDEPIKVAMAPLARCVAKAVDEDGSPVAGVKVMSWPNVSWWNSVGQVYCHPLVRCERLLRDREYNNAIDKAFPTPFQGKTDSQGKLTLELPMGNEQLSVSSDVYELPVLLGHRDVPVELSRDKATEAVLRLQPRGTQKLGE